MSEMGQLSAGGFDRATPGWSECTLYKCHKVTMLRSQSKANAGFRDGFVDRAQNFRLELDLFGHQDAWLPALAVLFEICFLRRIARKLCLLGSLKCNQVGNSLG